MPTLSDFIGTLVKEAAKARMLADLESVMLAESYYQDKYLKHLPVPHFTMPDITIEMPLAITQINPSAGKTNAQILAAIKQRLKDDLPAYLEEALNSFKKLGRLTKSVTLRTVAITPSALVSKASPLRTRLQQSINAILDTCFGTAGKYVDINKNPIRMTVLSDDIEILLTRELSANYAKAYELDEDSLKNIVRGAKEIFMNNVGEVAKGGDISLEIISSTLELRDLGQRECLTTLKLTMKERDYEWSIGESDGEDVSEERHLSID